MKNKDLSLVLKEIKYFPYTTVYVLKIGDNEFNVKRTNDKISCMEDVNPSVESLLISFVKHHLSTLYTQSDY